MVKINIVKNVGSSVEEDLSVDTDSFILAYLENGRIKITGNLDIRSFGFILPELVKFFADKMSSPGVTQ